MGRLVSFGSFQRHEKQQAEDGTATIWLSLDENGADRWLWRRSAVLPARKRIL